MAWPFTTATNWDRGVDNFELPDNYPVDANTIIYGGCPVGLNAASTPVNCARALSVVTPDVFVGFAQRTADNTTATAANPNPLNGGNSGDGTTGVNGDKVRVMASGMICFPKSSATPGATGMLGGITGLAGTQADVNLLVYFDGSGFTNTSSGNVMIGSVQEVTKDAFGVVQWKVRFRGAQVRST